ncbi:hypothetical protein AXG93_3457s1450 [Marchantia polymorpha subsp. ruderalis]|uniref:DUF1995 domain-containing protein n=1 Tax=Marchantia polymorpha subsp. ruderalis TaxID=1480154 RepID=A0A176VZG5_MARPO|nr:hypothetical protein AXG93_3457s1450 [Marchantia polymorpha subsp. ruderalis]
MAASNVVIQPGASALTVSISAFPVPLSDIQAHCMPARGARTERQRHRDVPVLRKLETASVQIQCRRFERLSATNSRPFSGARVLIGTRRRSSRDRAAQSKNPANSIAVSASSSSSVEFPNDYDELMEQVKTATKSALKDSKLLMEIEFPTGGLDSVPGDVEGGIEMSTSMLLVREFCRVFSDGDRAGRTRIFFPDVNEVESARENIFAGTSFKLDYLTKPSGLNDIGLGKKEKMADHVQAADEVFVCAYPYFNVNEMIAVEELYRESAQATRRPLIVFNGELDRIRSGWCHTYNPFSDYPSFFYPKLGSLAKNFLPKFETVYYIHNFKGQSGGVLFRAYPGPWQVLRRVDFKYICLHEQPTMPTLKEVALNILPAYR